MKTLFICLAIVAAICSCEPRIDLDHKQWGDKAFLTNVQIFKLDVDQEAKLVEWHKNESPMTGVRRIVISVGNAVIDKENFTATVQLKAGESLVGAGLIFYYTGTLIEPQGDAPRAGIPNDLSAESFTYVVHSADGSRHNWQIVIQ